MSVKLLTPEQITAYTNLVIPTSTTAEGGTTGNRIIICLDGGGIRGILPIQLLKKIEEIAGIPCYKFCDFISGTSTGGIIAGLIAAGMSAAEIEDKYKSLVKSVFARRWECLNKDLDPPLYDKANYRKDLKDIFGDATMQEVCSKTGVDLMILSRDLMDNTESFFACVHNGDWTGMYKDALIRAVLETTMSAPTYFSSLERFIDGGTTTFNNPSASALVEALEYLGKDKYDVDALTIFSFGTGKTVISVTPEQAAHPGKLPAIFWLNYVLETTNQDANFMQSSLFRSRVFSSIDYRRYQVALDPVTMKMLPDNPLTPPLTTDASSIHSLTGNDLDCITLDDFDKFELMSDIGLAVVDFIMADNKFQSDLNNKPPFMFTDQLAPLLNHQSEIVTNLSSAAWINKQNTK